MTTEDACTTREWLIRAVHDNYSERAPLDRPLAPRIWAYTDRISYSGGEVVHLSVNTNAQTYAVRVYLDAIEPVEVFRSGALEGRWRVTPADCSVVGCGWPVSLEIPVGADWPSGGYVVETSAIEDGATADIHEHIFLVRPTLTTKRSNRLLLVAATSTWAAYNDWGGSNYYQGITGPEQNQFSPILCILRPLAKGFVNLPPEALRAVLQHSPGPMTEPRYPHMEWAYANGYSKKYMSSGWAAFERLFVHWAIRQGYELDIISQTDLHFAPDILERYRCAAFIGHDEYWSWEMRDAVDAFVDGGGKAARFAGNFMWQIRMEDAGATQVCYKYRARDEDPLMKSGHRHLVTESWESEPLGRPGSLTFGLNATRGMYASWSGCSPRGAKGFPIYRPEHWAFEQTGLYYGDILGAESAIFGYEVDGIDYEIRGGLPHVAPGEIAPDGMQILGLGLSSTIEEGPTIVPGRSFLGLEDGEYVASVLAGDSGPEAIERTKRGCGAIVNFHRGRGEVFHAGTSDWVAGLQRNDPMVERVTRNVLDRYLR